MFNIPTWMLVVYWVGFGFWSILTLLMFSYIWAVNEFHQGPSKWRLLGSILLHLIWPLESLYHIITYHINTKYLDLQIRHREMTDAAAYMYTVIDCARRNNNNTLEFWTDELEQFKEFEKIINESRTE